MRTRILFMIVLLCSMTLMSGAGTVSIDSDRMLIADGIRLFVLGLYENPKDDAVLREAAEAGFNLVHVAETQEALDRLEAHGLYGWVNTGSRIDLSEDIEARTENLREMVRHSAGHPALLVWEVPDEALWNTWYSAILWRGGEEPRQLAERINALQDTAERERLATKLERSRALHREGRYVESEQLANELWRDLGQTAPQSDLGLANAPERAARLCQGLMKGRALLRDLDPAHPVWMNHAPRNQIAQLAQFNEAADIVGCDIYPVPESPHVGHSDLRDRTPASVGAYTIRMQEAAPGKPVWMVLQGFGWGDIRPEQPPEVREQLRRPTLEETRFMAFDAIVHGARGILYWGTAYIEKDSQCWRDLLTVVKELHDLQPVLTGQDAPQESVQVIIHETYGSHDNEVVVSPKLVNGKWRLIVVNECGSPLTYTTVCAVPEIAGAFRDRYSGAAIEIGNGSYTHLIPGYGVQVFEPQAAE